MAESFFFFRIQTFHLAEAHWYNARKITAPHAHNVFHLVFYTADNDRNSFLLDGAEAESLPGMLVMTSPGEPHSFQALRPGKTVYHELTFSLENPSDVFRGDWSQLMACYSGLDNVPVPSAILLDAFASAALDKHFRDLGILLKSLPGSMLPVLKGVTGMFEFLCGNVFMRKDSITQDNPLDKVKFYIDKHYHEDLSLKYLGRLFRVSPEHLCRKFKNAYGISPLKYALELKISTAKNMLLHSERSIKEISAQLNFSDVYAFSKYFKKTVGVSPGKYRHAQER